MGAEDRRDGGRGPRGQGFRAENRESRNTITRLNQHKNKKHCARHAVNLKKHSVYIKLGLTLQSLTILKFGELLLMANSPKFGFRYNSDKP